MMIVFVLIMGVHTHEGTAMTTQEFSNKQNCIAAGKAVEKKNKLVKWVCVQK